MITGLIPILVYYDHLISQLSVIKTQKCQVLVNWGELKHYNSKLANTK